MEYKCINIGSKRTFKEKHKLGKTGELKNINLTLNGGEIVGIVGLDSSGKTSLIDILSGIKNPTSGEISYSPKDLTRAYKEGKIKLNKFLSVYENMVYFGKKEKMSELEVESRMVQLRDIFGLDKVINSKINELTNTDKVKVEICMSLLSYPRILFIDEAFNFLSFTSKNEILKCLKRLNKEERTIIVLSSTSINDIDKIVNRIIVLDNYSIVYDGDYNEFKNKYCHKKVFDIYLNKKLSIQKTQGIEIIESSDYYYKLLVDKSNDMLSKVANLFDVNNVMDLSISNIPLVDMISKIKGEKND